MTTTQRPRVYLDIDIGAEPAGRLTAELFTDKTPKTCENFRALCIGADSNLSYVKSPFHRIIDEFMVQGGDITRGDGTGGDSIYGGEFDDENLGWRDMDTKGLLCMANRGKATNTSQFFITLEACPHLNNKHTVFGRLVAGEDTLQRMAQVSVDKDDKPHTPVLISRCGELERKKTATATATAPAHQSSTDRGRRHKRHSSSISRSPSPRPEKYNRLRRQSDNIVDETLRGRPRARSSGGSAGEDAVVEEEESTSPHKHKRKRSPSPSRGVKKASRETSRSPQGSRRRRRSLPNQYYDADVPGRPNDGDRRDNRGQGQSQGQHWRGGNRDRGRRDNRSYRPRQGQEEGRLGNDAYASAGAGPSDENGIKFKGRGSMKYREPDRRW